MRQRERQGRAQRLLDVFERVQLIQLARTSVSTSRGVGGASELLAATPQARVKRSLTQRP
jgi:hypothetical protein